METKTGPGKEKELCVGLDVGKSHGHGSTQREVSCCRAEKTRELRG